MADKNTGAVNKGVKVVDVFDIDPVAACDIPVEFELLHPATEDGLGVFISILGDDSTIVKDATKKRLNRKIVEAQTGGRRGSRKKKLEQTIEDSEQIVAEDAALATTGWRNMVYHGKELTFSYENALMVYRERDWVLAQVIQNMKDLELFMSASSSN